MSNRSLMSFACAIALFVSVASWASSPTASSAASLAQPASLGVSRENPHYLEYRGRPILLISSAEHYGAVINLDFDFVPYLDELRKYGLNQTRLWTGFYVEDPAAFNITNNTLAPGPNRYQPPWARSSEPGYANGGNKFDVTQWNPAFFTRLRRFLTEAARRDVMVEVVLFCPFYQDSMWKLSPLNPTNNINGLATGLSRLQVYDLGDAAVTKFQETYVRKIVTEVNAFDNVYFELVNEPYARNMIGEAFQRRMAEVVVETERTLPKQHLIAQNISNGSRVIDDPNPAVSIFNFHYAAPPDAVTVNYRLGRVIADDETGFRGQSDLPYRLEAWNFLLAGGGSYSHLDYSFTTAHPGGTWMPLPKNQPGGGGQAFRSQMRVLADFMKRFAFVRMAPAQDVLVGSPADDLRVRVLAESGRQYAIYISIVDSGRPAASAGAQPDIGERTWPSRETDLALTLPAGRYAIEWVSPMTGEVVKREQAAHAGGRLDLHSPTFTTDIALRVLGTR